MTYCKTCGITRPHHWAGCPKDIEGVGLPEASVAWVPRRLTAAERLLTEAPR